MDKNTLSNYGWIVIAVLVLAVMIALATPFGNFIADGFKATYMGFDYTSDNAMNTALNSVGVKTPESCGIEGHYVGDDKGEHGIAATCANGHTYTCECSAWTVPEGATYYVGVTSTATGDYTGATATYTAGDEFPTTVNDGDVYVYGDYEYRYNNQYSGTKWVRGVTIAGWGVRVLDTIKTTYGTILESINEKSVKSMYATFYNCTSLTTAPEIPNSITNMNNTFRDCTSLTIAPEIPSSVTSVWGTFMGCNYLTTAPTIPNSITNLHYTFYGCTSLTTAPAIPSSVTDMGNTFRDCTSLTGEISIPCSLVSKNYTYTNCPATITYYHINGCDGSCGA